MDLELEKFQLVFHMRATHLLKMLFLMAHQYYLVQSKYTSIEHPIRFYGIPSVIFLIIGGIFTYFAIQYYTEVGRLSTNLTLVGAGTILLGMVLLITAILLYSLVSVVREEK